VNALLLTQRGDVSEISHLRVRAAIVVSMAVVGPALAETPSDDVHHDLQER